MKIGKAKNYSLTQWKMTRDMLRCDARLTFECPKAESPQGNKRRGRQEVQNKLRRNHEGPRNPVGAVTFGDFRDNTVPQYLFNGERRHNKNGKEVIHSVQSLLVQ